MKRQARNVVLIMSGGVGSRFGANAPKQYCLMNGKPIIEYAINACRHASSVDEIVIVTAKEYLESVHKRYGFPTTEGGNDRQTSLANGLRYVAENYRCEKILVANAVCPLMQEEQINKYFELLDQYDYVLTCWKVVSTLHTYRGENIDRNDYFHVMEPEAYRFPLLFKHYRADFPVPYIFHQLPSTSKGFHCFDYPHTMKITYASDVKIAEILYKDYIENPTKSKTFQNINLWLSSFNPADCVSEWLTKLPKYMEELSSRWEITSYTINPQTFATCVFEASSRRFGDVIIKFHAPSGRYAVESLYYRYADTHYMAKMFDCDDTYRAMLIEKIKPGIHEKFDPEDPRLKVFFDHVATHMIPIETVQFDIEIPTILSEFNTNIRHSDKYNFQLSFKHRMEELAQLLWTRYFADAPMFFLHRDLHRRNLLRCYDSIKAIDPLGVIGPKEFEYTINFVIEAKANLDRPTKTHQMMLDYFSAYCDRERLYAAVFITWVHKMDEYVFVKHDNFKLATWVADYIRTIFFNGNPCDESQDIQQLFFSCYK